MKDLNLHFLKTTWSDIIILQYGEKLGLIDTGFEGQYVRIADYIKNLGCDKLEFIVITHFHNDHYGSLEKIIKNFKVDKVYMKEYNGLDYTNSDGAIATEEYRKSELDYFRKLQLKIKRYSKLINLEDVSKIQFEDLTLNVHNNQNLILKAYNDLSYVGHHTFKYNENINSVAISLEFLNKTILLSGDILDKEDNCPYINKINFAVAQEINKQIDIYKVPHHGENKSNSKETLAIYKPKINIITNSLDYVRRETSTISDIYNSYKESKFLFTEHDDVVVSIKSQNGDIEIQKGNIFRFEDIISLS